MYMFTRQVTRALSLLYLLLTFPSNFSALFFGKKYANAKCARNVPMLYKAQKKSMNKYERVCRTCRIQASSLLTDSIREEKWYAWMMVSGSEIGIWRVFLSPSLWLCYVVACACNQARWSSFLPFFPSFSLSCLKPRLPVPCSWQQKCKFPQLPAMPDQIFYYKNFTVSKVKSL